MSNQRHSSCQIKRNLPSVTTITNCYLKVPFDKTTVEISSFDGVIVERTTCSNNLYQFIAYIAYTRVSTSKLWHERFGHLSLVVLKEMFKFGMVAIL